jgi:amino acid permease
LSSTYNFGRKIFRAGGLFGSVFSLVAATVGSGNITLAYAIMKNGYVLGPLIVTLGALLSYYTSMLLVKSADFTGKVRYEDIALQLYGPRAS